ncbi:sigma-70 family RNA polymerase sigma factor [Pseudomonas japonica]|uniref:sigma-70 family RNA polymerase sigma factor n=1 Tax=Pseudomonas TaxID=286 RepID=UPI0029286F3D|nr:sigma-70 family RNA polymerase sigma factor [Pseudomonas sp. zfem002]MDU9391278.1 sigma-70 family RNA polymerase sigma factor [Pseudomonas sp. zfem002]
MSTSEHAALHVLYSEHNGWLKSWLRARLGNAADAADLAQDTFIRVLNARNVQNIREPRSYLGSIAHALMVDRFRRRAVEQAYLAELALRPEQTFDSPETRLLILETLVAVDTLLDGLGERTRGIFLCVQLEGLTYAATAQRLGVSLNTVKKHLARAMTHCLLLTDD